MFWVESRPHWFFSFEQTSDFNSDFIAAETIVVNRGTSPITLQVLQIDLNAGIHQADQGLLVDSDTAFNGLI